MPFDNVEQPDTWRLDLRDLANHRVGQSLPSVRHRRFKSKQGASRELDRLRSENPGIVGFISASPAKPQCEQPDFGFPLGGPPRLTT